MRAMDKSSFMLESYDRATLPYDLRENIHPKIWWEWVRKCGYTSVSVGDSRTGAPGAWRDYRLLASPLLLGASAFELIYLHYGFCSRVINSVLYRSLLIPILPLF